VRDMVVQVAGSNGLLAVPEKHLPGQVVMVLFGPAIRARPDRRHPEEGLSLGHNGVSHAESASEPP